MTVTEAVQHSPRELASKALDAVAARDVAALERFWAKEVVEEFVPIGVFRGRAELRTFFEEMFAAIPDMKFEPLRIMQCDGRTAMGEWRLRGTFSGGRFQGIEPTGRRLDLRGVDIMEFDGGHLTRNTIYYDGMAFARQIGMLPPDASSGDRTMRTVFNAWTKMRKSVGGR